MGLFGFRKKPDVLDLTERYKKQQEKLSQMQSDAQETSSPSQNAFSFLGDLAGAGKPAESEEYVDISNNQTEKKRKLAKRLMDMTAKMEDLSNQIYHLQQRLEVLERKSGVGSY